MSGHGEKPRPDDEERASNPTQAVRLGETVYNEAGDELGAVRGLEEGGIFVTTRGGMEQLSIEHARSGHAFGEAHLMWRCMDCGEMGPLDDSIPDRCPDCGQSDSIEWWKED